MLRVSSPGLKFPQRRLSTSPSRCRPIQAQKNLFPSYSVPRFVARIPRVHRSAVPRVGEEDSDRVPSNASSNYGSCEYIFSEDLPDTDLVMVHHSLYSSVVPIKQSRKPRPLKYPVQIPTGARRGTAAYTPVDITYVPSRHHLVGQPEFGASIYGESQSLPSEVLSDDIPAHVVGDDTHLIIKSVHIISTTDSATEAWDAYETLSTLLRAQSAPDGVETVPYELLHRLARLLASSTPPTRTTFLRLLSALAALRRTGGKVQLWEWNALIDSAGKGWKKTRIEDYKSSLAMFGDLMSDTIQMQEGPPFSDGQDGVVVLERAEQPDIITYTTLLNIAARTLYPPIIRHANSLLKASGLAPNRITHLALLQYFTRTNQLDRVRSTVTKMAEQGLELGLDGLNACIWAFARNNRLDVALALYRVLRSNVVPEPAEHGVAATVRFLTDQESLFVPADLQPNQATYTMMIQVLCYEGDLMHALRVFVDMLSSPDIDSPVGHEIKGTQSPKNYSPSLAVFRALFLGFARHGKPSLPSSPKSAPVFTSRLLARTESRWTLDNLDRLFNNFLDLPPDTTPSERTIYWIMRAYGKTSNNDARRLRRIFKRLEDRFGGGWGGRLASLKKKIHA